MSIDRKPRTEQRWRDIIKDFHKSGHSIWSYCLSRGNSEGAVGKSIARKIGILNSLLTGRGAPKMVAIYWPFESQAVSNVSFSLFYRKLCPSS